MQVVYVGRSYEDEEKVLRMHGVECSRIEYPFIDKPSGIEPNAVFRGPKWNTETYSVFFDSLNQSGIRPLVNAEEYQKVADAQEYARCFGKYSPSVMVFEIGESPKQISKKLATAVFPMFVRSNVESAAKYVGVERCILRSNDQASIAEVLEPIYKHIKGAESIIMKQVVPMMKVGDQTVEYRAIVINDHIICFDYNSTGGLPAPESLECFPQFENCVSVASVNGLHGAYFVDFGLNVSGDVFIVECKNLFNGTIKNIDRFAEGIMKIK